MRTMKKLAVMAAVVMSAAMVAQAALSLADARAMISACINSPAKMTEIMKQLSASDQKKFLAEVNEAISKMPVSDDTLAATYLNVNRAALKGAQPGNLSELVAEVFATVPPESLTVINERFAADLFNRAADPSVTYTDEQYTQIAKSLMEKVNARMEGVENGAARSTFAILMLTRASNGSPADLSNTLVETLPEDAQNAARNEWIPAALGDKQAQSYEPILGGAEATGSMPSFDGVINIAGPQMLDSMLGDLVEGSKITQTAHNYEHTIEGSIKDSAPELVVEPRGYQGQTTGSSN